MAGTRLRLQSGGEDEVDSVSAAVTRTDNFIDETPTVATWQYAAPERLASIEYAKAAEMPLRSRYYPADEFMEVVGSKWHPVGDPLHRRNARHAAARAPHR